MAAIANRASTVTSIGLLRRSINLFRTLSTSASLTPTPSSSSATTSDSAEKSKRRKKKNLFEVAQFLPSWGVGFQMAKSHWRDVSYEITKINLYKDGRHGKAWGIRHKAAGVICEDLPQDLCAFAVSSSAKRCVLESYQSSGKPTEYQCRTSEVEVQRISNHIETDQCVKSCGVDRNSVGISSDSLLEPEFTAKLCSPKCYQNCPNIIDLYFNLAAGEGMFLPDLCQAQRSNPRRAMAEILSSGVADGPAAAAVATTRKIIGELDAPASAPAPAPMAA